MAMGACKILRSTQTHYKRHNPALLQTLLRIVQNPPYGEYTSYSI